ncbi:uncharacterized protein BKA55DRAFT_581727 [Fusarium redolens]|uniref:Uncharacterized protein n=1 Tax=Fusarium redolens TaxID=48865 RepID=A0A9P9G4A4_FUSRE|nr:uncharacterized protein BKA55DRAFT_581727 [Fusarium redolens]KAH7231767.1 hypothetical protein BKA55DRAFT_581727 [Fusarium redolens]
MPNTEPNIQKSEDTTSHHKEPPGDTAQNEVRLDPWQRWSSAPWNTGASCWWWHNPHLAPGDKVPTARVGAPSSAAPIGIGLPPLGCPWLVNHCPDCGQRYHGWPACRASYPAPGYGWGCGFGWPHRVCHHCGGHQ